MTAERVAANAPIAVLGCGTMGAGIAVVAARAGHPVRVLEADEAGLAAGRERIDSFLAESVRRGKLTGAERAEVAGRIGGVAEPSALAGAAVVLEAVVEDLQAKLELLPRVAAAVGDETIIASNTSALSVTRLAAAVPRPERFAGLHFFNPAPLMRLVEVVAAEQTAETTLAALEELSARFGKTAVRTRDRPGFLVNRLLIPYLNQVARAYDEGLASAEDLDTALELGLGYPMGGLRLLDLIGIDNHLHAAAAAYRHTGDPAFAPPPVLERMVAAGALGRKAGRGFRVDGDGHEEVT